MLIWYFKAMNKQQKNNLIKEIAKHYSLRLLLLFGSRVDGKNLHSESDFDVAYLSGRKLSLQQEAKMMLNLAPYFRSENIDLVNLKEASPLLFYSIFQKCKVLYQEDDLLFSNYRVYAFKKYIEAKPLYELKFKRFKEKIKTYPKLRKK